MERYNMKMKQISRKKTRIEAPQSTIKILLGIIFIVFLVSFVSSFDFDNVKSYDKNLQKVTVDNVFGLGSKIAELTLDTPLNNKVGLGYQRVAEITITNEGEYDNALKDLKLYDKKNNEKEFERDFDYKYKTLDTFQREVMVEDCKTPLVNGSCGIRRVTEEYKKEVWKPIGKDLPKGEVTIGIYTNVQ